MASGKIDVPIILKKYVVTPVVKQPGEYISYSIDNIDGYVPISVFLEGHSGTSTMFSVTLWFGDENKGKPASEKLWYVLLIKPNSGAAWTPAMFYVAYVKKPFDGYPDVV